MSSHSDARCHQLGVKPSNEDKLYALPVEGSAYPPEFRQLPPPRRKLQGYSRKVHTSTNLRAAAIIRGSQIQRVSSGEDESSGSYDESQPCSPSSARPQATSADEASEGDAEKNEEDQDMLMTAQPILSPPQLDAAERRRIREKTRKVTPVARRNERRRLKTQLAVEPHRPSDDKEGKETLPAEEDKEDEDMLFLAEPEPAHSGLSPQPNAAERRRIREDNRKTIPVAKRNERRCLQTKPVLGSHKSFAEDAVEEGKEASLHKKDKEEQELFVEAPPILLPPEPDSAERRRLREVTRKIKPVDKRNEIRRLQLTPAFGSVAKALQYNRQAIDVNLPGMLHTQARNDMHQQSKEHTSFTKSTEADIVGHTRSQTYPVNRVAASKQPTDMDEEVTVQHDDSQNSTGTDESLALEELIQKARHRLLNASIRGNQTDSATTAVIHNVEANSSAAPHLPSVSLSLATFVGLGERTATHYTYEFENDSATGSHSGKVAKHDHEDEETSQDAHEGQGPLVSKSCNDQSQNSQPLSPLEEEIQGLNDQAVSSASDEPLSPYSFSSRSSKRRRSSPGRGSPDLYDLETAIEDDEESDQPSPKKRRGQPRITQKVPICGAALNELIERRASKNAQPRKVPKTNAIPKPPSPPKREPRRLPVDELTIVSQKADNADAEDDGAHIIELPEDPISQVSIFSEQSHSSRQGKKSSRRLDFNSRQCKGFRSIDISKFRMPKIRVAAAQVGRQQTQSHSDGFEGSEAKPTGDWMPVKRPSRHKPTFQKLTIRLGELTLVAERTEDQPPAIVANQTGGPRTKKCKPRKQAVVPEAELVDNADAMLTDVEDEQNLGEKVQAITEPHSTTRTTSPNHVHEESPLQAPTRSSPLHQEEQRNQSVTLGEGSPHAAQPSQATSTQSVSLFRRLSSNDVSVSQQLQSVAIQAALETATPKPKDLPVSQQLMMVSIPRSSIAHGESDDENEDSGKEIFTEPESESGSESEDSEEERSDTPEEDSEEEAYLRSDQDIEQVHGEEGIEMIGENDDEPTLAEAPRAMDPPTCLNIALEDGLMLREGLHSSLQPLNEEELEDDDEDVEVLVVTEEHVYLENLGRLNFSAPQEVEPEIPPTQFSIPILRQEDAQNTSQQMMYSASNSDHPTADAATMVTDQTTTLREDETSQIPVMKLSRRRSAKALVPPINPLPRRRSIRIWSQLPTEETEVLSRKMKLKVIDEPHPHLDSKSKRSVTAQVNNDDESWRPREPIASSNLMEVEDDDIVDPPSPVENGTTASQRKRASSRQLSRKMSRALSLGSSRSFSPQIERLVNDQDSQGSIELGESQKFESRKINQINNSNSQGFDDLGDSPKLPLINHRGESETKEADLSGFPEFGDSRRLPSRPTRSFVPETQLHQQEEGHEIDEIPNSQVSYVSPHSSYFQKASQDLQKPFRKPNMARSKSLAIGLPPHRQMEEDTSMAGSITMSEKTFQHTMTPLKSSGRMETLMSSLSSSGPEKTLKMLTRQASMGLGTVSSRKRMVSMPFYPPFKKT